MKKSNHFQSKINDLAEEKNKVIFIKGRKIRLIIFLFIILLIIFSIFTFFLIQPHKTTGIYFQLDNSDNKLDDLNLTELQLIFNNSTFLANYTVKPSVDYEDSILDIIPKNNPDVLIILSKYGNDIYFYGEMAYEVHFPSSWNYQLAQETLGKEMEKILTILGLESLKDEIHFDDYDFAQIPDIITGFIYSYFLSLILVLAFAIFYDKGAIMDNILNHHSSVSMFSGLFLMFIGIGAFVWVLSMMNFITICPSICLIVAIIFIVMGALSILKNKKINKESMETYKSKEIDDLPEESTDPPEKEKEV